MRTIREKLNEIADMERRNNDRINARTIHEWLEPHMRKRLAQIRAMEVPAEVEPLRQEIIERYENDLATWVGK